jgi:molecular chaperone DnaK
VEIHVLQGERPMAADNKSLGKFTLDGIPPAPRGIPQVEVTFDIDADGILQVSALDKATGRSQNITITASSGLDEAEVEKMRRDAETYAEQDRKRREAAEARNAADNAIYSGEKLLRENREKVPQEKQSELESKIQSVRELLDSEDLETVRQTTSDLLGVIQEVGTAIHQEAATEPTSEDEEPGEGGGEEDVIEGEFTEA